MMLHVFGLAWVQEVAIRFGYGQSHLEDEDADVKMT